MIRKQPVDGGRYLDINGNWFNDDGADDYMANRFGGQDGVVDLTGPF